MFLIGLAVAVLGLALWVLVLGGDIANFIDIPTMILIFCPLLGVLTATQSFKVFWAGLKAAIFPKTEITEDMRGRAASLFRFLSKITMMVSGIGVLICLFNILINLNFSDARGLSSLGINMSCAFMSPFYGMLLVAIVFEPMVLILKKRHVKNDRRPS